jgi:hypothetical protein
LKKAVLGALVLLFYCGLVGLYRLNHAESESESEAPIAIASKVTRREDATPILDLPKEAVANAGIEMKSFQGAFFTPPPSAIVRNDGRTWVYFQLSEGKFSREEIEPESNSERGAWKLEGPAPSSIIVTVGAQTLLSEEMKSQISVGDED